MSVSPWYVVSFVAVVCRAVGFGLNRPTLRIAQPEIAHGDRVHTTKYSWPHREIAWPMRLTIARGQRSACSRRANLSTQRPRHDDRMTSATRRPQHDVRDT